MTLEHIKQLRLLVEQAQTPNMGEFMTMIMEKIKQHLSEKLSPGGRAEWIDEWLHDLLSSDTEMLRQAQTLGLEKNLTTWAWINQEFKKATGVSLVNFEMAAQRAHDDVATADASEDVKSLLRLLSNKMTFKISPRDVSNLAWYVLSPKKIVVTMPDNLNVPEAVLSDVSAQALGTTLPELKTLLQHMGVRQIPRPKVHKSAPSYYD